jgi:hypothetical protein
VDRSFDTCSQVEMICMSDQKQPAPVPRRIFFLTKIALRTMQNKQPS